MTILFRDEFNGSALSGDWNTTQDYNSSFAVSGGELVLSTFFSGFDTIFTNPTFDSSGGAYLAIELDTLGVSSFELGMFYGWGPVLLLSTGGIFLDSTTPSIFQTMSYYPTSSFPHTVCLSYAPAGGTNGTVGVWEYVDGVWHLLYATVADFSSIPPVTAQPSIGHYAGADGTISWVELNTALPTFGGGGGVTYYTPNLTGSFTGAGTTFTTPGV